MPIIKKVPKTNLLGIRIAASYGIIPNTLGFCGPQEAKRQKVLRDFLERGAFPQKTRKVLEQFEGAFPYYKLIARKNNIKDPFDEKVVTAYWIGNGLLEKVRAADLKKMIMEEFTKPNLLSKEIARERLKKVPQNSKPHHSFHVFILGSVTGRIDLEDAKLKDVCRVGWGEVVRIKNKKLSVVVKYSPVVRNKKLALGKSREKEIICGKKMISKIRKGDWVSFHWNNLIQKLSPEEIANLEKYTKNSLNLV